MQKSYSLYFVSSNKNKFKEAKTVLKSFNIELCFFNQELQEIQSDSLKKIAQFKAVDAYKKLKKPVIVEDDGLFIDSLGGFPGPYSSYVFRTIGNDGILKLLKQKRNAKFISIITFCNDDIIKNFEASVTGNISKTSKGIGWGYDPIFTPKNSSKTFAEINNKNEISHRFKALKKFSNWYNQESSVR